MRKSGIKLLTSTRSLNWRRAVLVMVPVVAVGILVVWRIFAAGSPLAFEPEAGTLSGSATNVADANASGGQAVKFAAPTPTPTPGACTGAANTPGGPDPWGGCWPGPNNTGYPHGLPGDTRTPVTLTVHTGDIDITQAGYVLQNMEVDGCIHVRTGANNVIIKNVLVKTVGCYWVIRNDASGLQVSDTEIDGLNDVTHDGIAGDYTATRVDIHGTADGAKASNDTIQDSYIHDLIHSDTSHNDGIQTLGTTGLTIRHNTIFNQGDGTSIILSTGSATDMRNIFIDKNLFAGGGYTVYGGYSAGRDNLAVVSNINITNNRFSTVYHPNSGGYGPLTSDDPPVVHTGNLWADGPSAGQDLD